MDYQIVLSPQAIANLRAITSWIARENKSRAESFGNELLDRVAILQKFPLAGSPFFKNKRWRKLVSHPYVIIYRVSQKPRKVEVLAFKNSAQSAFTS